MTAHTPYNKILVANRGEIALRVMRSARILGYRTVAVYSTADASARHCREADQAVCIGEALPAQSYLNIPAIIDAANRTGADAVHPGYGFLAENAEFAHACKYAGLIFIGPSPEAIQSMGDKARAKTLMGKADVPCIPGYEGADQNDQLLANEATRIGYPLMIKASAGGGGRGMRVVRSAEEFDAQLRSARSEAKYAFGDETVILERAIVNARHIEVQVIADRHGNVIHLGERDCSLQRRHQKVIEESPSPVVNADLRTQMGTTAVAAARAIGYEGAGTLEFLLDGNDNYYFMEMNTRLQVEHPVTEAITGLDLVELQLRIAAGEKLPVMQSDVTFTGHAIEARLCAEDAAESFLPQSGTMELWEPPAQLRVDHALYSGAQISPYYDSMIAKIISHGRTRDEARRKLLRGLEDTVALGVTTNQDFLSRCLSNAEFASGQATTSFVDSHLAELQKSDVETRKRSAAIAATLLLETDVNAHRTINQRRMTHNLPISMRLSVDGNVHAMTLVHLGQCRYEVQSDDHKIEVELLQSDANQARLSIDRISESATYFRDGARLLVHYCGQTFNIEDKTRAAAARQDEAGDSDGKLRAIMDGRVVAVLVAVGDKVEARQPIATIEAMKMEHVHSAPASGTVTALNVAVGDQVAARNVMVEIDSGDEPRAP